MLLQVTIREAGRERAELESQNAQALQTSRSNFQEQLAALQAEAQQDQHVAEKKASEKIRLAEQVAQVGGLALRKLLRKVGEGKEAAYSPHVTGPPWVSI